jgi:hypothetical protein
LTADEVGEILRVSAKTVRRLPLSSVPLGTGRRRRWLYRREDIERWIEEHVT